MKKTFSLSHPKKAPARMGDSAKNQIKKYFKRERGKALPEGFDYWDFDCRFGEEEAGAKTIVERDISKAIESVIEDGKLSFYMEILAKPIKKPGKKTSAE